MVHDCDHLSRILYFSFTSPSCGRISISIPSMSIFFCLCEFWFVSILVFVARTVQPSSLFPSVVLMLTAHSRSAQFSDHTQRRTRQQIMSSPTCNWQESDVSHTWSDDHRASLMWSSVCRAHRAVQERREGRKTPFFSEQKPPSPRVGTGGGTRHVTSHLSAA